VQMSLKTEKLEDPEITAWRKRKAEATEAYTRWFKHNEPLIEGVDDEELVALGLEDDSAFNSDLLRSTQSFGPTYNIPINPVR
jgi:hypothetical protein